MGALMWRYMGLSCAKPETPHLLEWLEALEQREAFRRTVMDVPRARNPAEWARIEKESG
jgi:glutathione S-transferase